MRTSIPTLFIIFLGVNMKPWLRTTLLALVSSFLVACGGSDNPANVAETFFKELQRGDADKAMDLIYLPPQAAQVGINKQDIKAELTMMANAGKANLEKHGSMSGQNVKAGEVSYTNGDETEATVKIIVKLKNGTEETETIPMIKTDKGWKIHIK